VTYLFGRFRLDTDRYELTEAGEAVHVEPLVFDLLTLFVANSGVVIDRDRMIETVWGGRIVSEATLSTAVKSARRCLGDSGETQSFIETVRGRGFRFRVPVVMSAPATAPAPEAAAEAAPEAAAEPEAEAIGHAPGAPSIAVLPFVRIGDPEPHPGLEEALPHEVILALARLRSLFVIARGSCFRFRGPDQDLVEVRRALGARYVVFGTIETYGRRITVGVELAETAGGAVLWGERYTGTIDDVHALRAQIVAGVCAALDVQIPLAEARQAQGRAIENLDAWQAFHLGLRHVHQYTAAGNAAAQALFRRALARDPTFARAHAGLSFVHFQNAFLHYRPDREAEIATARACAEEAVALDPLDPFANFNMGRSHWLRQEIDAAMPWLERATAISPSYAQGLYSHALMDTLSGQSTAGFRTAELAIGLSPLDPLLYAMRATKALARLVDGDDQEAARIAEAAARTPGAHVVIAMIAAATQTLVGDDAAARHWEETVRHTRPDAGRAHFFECLPIRHAPTRERISAALERRGF
jgi:TolB-like protein